jgi:hypothetical protein
MVVVHAALSAEVGACGLAALTAARLRPPVARVRGSAQRPHIDATSCTARPPSPPTSQPQPYHREIMAAESPLARFTVETSSDPLLSSRQGVYSITWEGNVLAAHASSDFNPQRRGNSVVITCARTGHEWIVDCDNAGAAACLHEALKVVKKHMKPTWVHASTESLISWRARH